MITGHYRVMVLTPLSTIFQLYVWTLYEYELIGADYLNQ